MFGKVHTYPQTAHIFSQHENKPPQSGKAALQEYISFASTGILDVGEELEREPDSDFEIALIRALKDQGYDAVPQVGVDGFRIDIGVRHPDYPYGFIAGVECDGATYHSSKSARDRDKIRQDILEGLGWKIYRVWSTDWFMNQEKEMQKMSEKLEFFKNAALSTLKRSQKKSSPDTKLEALNRWVKEKQEDKSSSNIVSIKEKIESLNDIKHAQEEENNVDKIELKQEPFGRRRELEHNVKIIVFYEDNATFFEVWEDEKLIGEIEKKGIVTERAVLFGGKIQGIQLPKYETQLLVPVSITKTFEDVRIALRWIHDTYLERIENS